jgi:phosphoserine phosphatase
VEDVSKKTQEQLKNAEKKYQSLIEKRNELNDIAKLVREERDMINEKRKELRELSEKCKKERDELVAKMRLHKELRNKLQQQAKELIKERQRKKGHVVKSLPLRVEELKADIQMLEYKQETTPMDMREENELIDQIKAKRKEYEESKKELERQQLIETDISDADRAITELFRQADEEHEKVQRLYNESQAKHEEYMRLIKEIAASINESNKKHQRYVEIREEAQRHHEKAMEMLSKILSARKERRKRWLESKEILRSQNIKVQKELFDEKKLEDVANKSFSALKEGKKISLSG